MANTYSVDIGALPALASGIIDDSAPAIESGDPLSDTDILRASQQHDKRKVLRKYGKATPQEVLASKKRKVQVTSENAGTVGPAWAQNLQQQMQNMQQQMQNMQQQMQNMRQQFPLILRIDRLQSINLTNSSNAMATVQMLPRLSDGNLPASEQELWVPKTFADLDQSSASDATNLLIFYELNAQGTVHAKRRRLRNHFCGS